MAPDHLRQRSRKIVAFRDQKCGCQGSLGSCDFQCPGYQTKAKADIVSQRRKYGRIHRSDRGDFSFLILVWPAELHRVSQQSSSLASSLEATSTIVIVDVYQDQRDHSATPSLRSTSPARLPTHMPTPSQARMTNNRPLEGLISDSD